MQLIVHRKVNGISEKVWKLSSKKALHVAGRSKKADLYLPTSEFPVWMGFEFKDNQWHLLNLSGDASQSFVEMTVSGPMAVECPQFSLELFPIETQFEFVADNQVTNPETAKELGVLVLSSSQKRVTESKVYSQSEFSNKYPNLSATFHWNRFDKSESAETVHYKLTSLHSQLAKELHNEPREKDPAYRYLHAITLFTLFLGISFYLLLPNEKAASEVALDSVPPKSVIKEVRMEPKKKPKPQKAQGSQMAANSNAKPNSKQASGQSAFGSNSRIAQMIARISNSSAKSKNVVIVKNAKEGDASPTVSALSVADQMGGSANGLSQVGGATSGVSVGTLSNQNGNGSGSGRGLSAISDKLTGIGGTAGASALDEEADVEGGLDPEVIANFIKSKLGEILYCYERQLSSNPNLYGKVGVRFIIGGSGSVESTRIFQSSLQSSPVENCINQKIGKWKFPTPKGGTQVVVTYPFLFKNTN